MGCSWYGIQFVAFILKHLCVFFNSKAHEGIVVLRGGIAGGNYTFDNKTKHKKKTRKKSEAPSGSVC